MNGYRFQLIFKIRVQTGKPPCKNWTPVNINFDLITDAYNSKYCKPNLDYYREICEKISIAPVNCLMVGNDAFNDMIASDIGMKTFLVTNTVNSSVEVSREIAGLDNVKFPEPDFKGKLEDIITVLSNYNKY